MKNRTLDDFKHVAFIFHENQICGVGYNIINIKDQGEHAEYRALKDLQRRIGDGQIKPKRFIIIVMRVVLNKTNGEIYMKMSKPCINCQKMLKHQNLIKKVYWSTDNNCFDHCSVNSL